MTRIPRLFLAFGYKRDFGAGLGKTKDRSCRAGVQRCCTPTRTSARARLANGHL